MAEDSTKGLSNVIWIDDERIQDHLKHVVRGSVEETLNALPEAEADRLCGAGRYERTATAPRHLGRRAGLVDEDRPLGVQIGLSIEPGLPATENVRPRLLADVHLF